jgi:hypothetical protein
MARTWRALLPFLPALSAARVSAAAAPCLGELLYNGICLPAVWPPNNTVLSRDPVDPPYLAAPPEIINITVGRQLFVDMFLLDPNATQVVLHATNAAATTHANIAAGTATVAARIEYYTPIYDAHNPVVSATKPWECSTDITQSFASAFSGGIWFDSSDALFKLWFVCSAPRLWLAIGSTFRLLHLHARVA